MGPVEAFIAGVFAGAGFVAFISQKHVRDVRNYYEEELARARDAN